MRGLGAGVKPLPGVLGDLVTTELKIVAVLPNFKNISVVGQRGSTAIWKGFVKRFISKVFIIESDIEHKGRLVNRCLSSQCYIDDKAMSLERIPIMEFEPGYDIENVRSTDVIKHDMWPLGEIDPKKGKFPCCLVWTPLPVVSWLAPFIGHVGICREDGTILDFSGSNFVNVDAFAFGAVARYLQLHREKCCFPPNLAEHTCKHRYLHAEYGTSLTWDDALQSSVSRYETKSYNLFTCNCHSFVANCLNRLCHGGTMDWNMVNVAFLVLFKGKWVDTWSVVRSFFPFVLVVCIGVLAVGWAFLVGLMSFSLLLVVWYLMVAYCFKNLIDQDACL